MTRAGHDSSVAGTPWAGIVSVHTRTARPFPKHWHDSYGIGLMEDGAHRSASARGQVEAFAGDVITYNPGELHDGRPVGATTRRWRMLCVDEPAMRSAIAESGCGAEIGHPVIRDGEVVSAVRRLFRRLARWTAAAAPDQVRSIACDEALVEVCTLLAVRYRGTLGSDGHVPEQLRRVRERLEHDMLRPPSLDEMAAMTGQSRFKLLRHFERAYGLPPHRWLLRRRAERARALIRAGASLAAAAAQSGFADQSHMTRVFVRQFGFTPGAWRGAAARATP